MSLVDIPVTDTVADKAVKIRELLASTISNADHSLDEIRNLVQKYGRANIAAELGDDAAAMLTVYATLKKAIEIATENEVEDLP